MISEAHEDRPVRNTSLLRVLAPRCGSSLKVYAWRDNARLCSAIHGLATTGKGVSGEGWHAKFCNGIGAHVTDKNS